MSTFTSKFAAKSTMLNSSVTMLKEDEECVANRPDGNSDDARRVELRAKREACMADIQRQIDATLDDMKSTAKRLLEEIGAHVNITHNVIYDYENVLDTQQKEASRLDEVSKTVSNATNPFLENSVHNT
jgi:hypothetical protein